MLRPLRGMNDDSDLCEGLRGKFSGREHSMCHGPGVGASTSVSKAERGRRGGWGVSFGE